MSAQNLLAFSADGVPIHYDLHGKGPTALVFIHGWSCNHRYWAQQVRHFSKDYTTVSLDLAGHGGSGADRAQWTMSAFGQDVVAVVNKLEMSDVARRFPIPKRPRPALAQSPNRSATRRLRRCIHAWIPAMVQGFNDQMKGCVE